MKDTKLSMVRGDTLAFGVVIDGLDQDLDTAYFSCKKNIDDTEYVFQKSLSDGISKVETGKYRVRVAPADTSEAELGDYYYDLQIGVNSDIYTVLRGKLIIEYEITEAEA